MTQGQLSHSPACSAAAAWAACGEALSVPLLYLVHFLSKIWPLIQLFLLDWLLSGSVLKSSFTKQASVYKLSRLQNVLTVSECMCGNDPL